MSIISLNINGTIVMNIRNIFMILIDDNKIISIGKMTKLNKKNAIKRKNFKSLLNAG